MTTTTIDVAGIATQLGLECLQTSFHLGQKTAPLNTKRASGSLKDFHLKIAYEALSATQKAIPHSYNYLLDGVSFQVNRATPEGKALYQKKWSEVYDIVENKVRPVAEKIFSLQKLRSDFNYLYIQARVAAYYGGGNCGEKTAYAFVYLSTHYDVPLDVCELFPGNHAFLLIGKERDILFDNRKKWGDGVVVCDPLLNLAYFATEDELQKHMGAFKGSGEKGNAVKEPYYHKTHFILPYVSNLYSYKEFCDKTPDFFIGNFSRLRKLFNEFYRATTATEKYAIGEKILQSPLKNKLNGKDPTGIDVGAEMRVAANLFSQIQFYLETHPQSTLNGKDVLVL